jgi:hypothetical protein
MSASTLDSHRAIGDTLAHGGGTGLIGHTFLGTVRSRCRAEPLGKLQAATWGLLLSKLAAVIVNCCRTVVRWSGIGPSVFDPPSGALALPLTWAFEQAVDITGVSQFQAPICCALRSHRPKYPPTLAVPRSWATASISVCSCHPRAVNGYPEGLLPEDWCNCTIVQRPRHPLPRDGRIDMNQECDRQYTPGQTPVAVRGTHGALGEPGPQPGRGRRVVLIRDGQLVQRPRRVRRPRRQG